MEKSLIICPSVLNLLSVLVHEPLVFSWAHDHPSKDYISQHPLHHVINSAKWDISDSHSTHFFF
jgi:hypothetical protein